MRRQPLSELEILIQPDVVPSVAAAAGSSSRLFSNGAAMAAANLAGRGLGYISIILMARKLNASYIGVYALLYTTSMLVELVANLGLDKLLMREIAGGSHQAGKGFFWAALPIRLTMAALSTFVAWILLSAFFKHQLLVTPLVVALFLSVIFPVVATRNCESFLTAHERLVPIALSQLGERVVMFAAVLLLITNHLSFSGMLCIAPLAAIVRLGIVAFSTKRIWIPNIVAESPHLGRLIRQSLELFLVDVLALIYFRSDVFIMAKVRGLGDTGVYQIAYKIFDLCLSLFSGFLQAAFPLMVRNRSRQWLMNNLLVGSGLLMIPVAIIIAFRHLILGVFKHQYETGSTALIWLMLTVPLVYINSTLANKVVVAGRVRMLGFLASLLVALNIGLNIYLIPKWSMNGAAVVTFACEMVSIVSLVPWVIRILQREKATL
jgi:O-antigen/teichoic acid export membrane protein